MKDRTIPAPKAWRLLLFLILLYGCASPIPVEEYGQQFMVRPLSELKQEMQRPDSYASKIKWKEATYPLANGNYIFIQPLSKDCSINWEVNKKDLIVGFTPEGDGCEKAPATGKDMIRTMTTPAPDW